MRPKVVERILREEFVLEESKLRNIVQGEEAVPDNSVLTNTSSLEACAGIKLSSSSTAH